MVLDVGHAIDGPARSTYHPREGHRFSFWQDRATVARSTSSARGPAFLTRWQISSMVLKPGSTTHRQDGWPRKSNTPPVAMTWSRAWPTASRNHSSFHRPVRKATMSLGGLM